MPPANEHPGEIYVVGPVGKSGNAYEEYIAVDTAGYGDDYTWELVGGSNTSIDLTGYVTKDDLSSTKSELQNQTQAVRNLVEQEYSTTSEVENMINEAALNNKVDLSNYYTKEEIENKGYLKTVPTEYVTEVELNNTINNFSFDGGVTDFK